MANKITVGQVLGEDMQKRTVSCQWHYLRCAKNECVHIYQSILPLCKKYGCMKWLEFWNNRQVHFVPAFHGFGYPGLNLAKADQSTMRQKQLTLVDAAFDDVIRQMQQDKIYQLTLQNEVKGLGCQTKTINDIYQEGEEAQKQHALRYAKTLQDFMKNQGKLWNEMPNIPCSQDASAFHPDEDAKHKFISDSNDDKKGYKKQGKKQGKKGQKRKVQKDATTEDNVKKTKQGRGKGRGKTSTRVQPSSTSSSSHAAQEQGTSTLTSSQAVQGQGTSTLTSSQAVQGQTGQSSPYGPQVPNACEAENINNEVPTVILYYKLMHLCYPEKCRKEWNPQFTRHLHNMLFCMKTFRRYYNKQGKLVIPKVCMNAYFCFRSLDFLKLVHNGIDYCDLYMGNYYFKQLTQKMLPY